MGDTMSIDDNSKNGHVKEDENGNISKVLLNNSNETSSNRETEASISIQIVSSESSNNNNKKEQTEQQQRKSSQDSVKLPVVSKVHINHGEETRSNSSAEEEEMIVNIYNVTKSVVTCEKPTITAVVKESIEEKHVIIENNNVVKEETTVNSYIKPETVTQEEEFRRSPSPQWTYTLPAPPILNSIESVNNNTNNCNSPTDQKAVGNKYFSDYMSTINDNDTILSDSNTTTVSAETHIKPIINDRRKPLDDFTATNSIVVNSTPTTAVIDDLSDKSGEIITSDLEDGYLMNNKVKINTDNDNEISVIEEVSTPKRNDVLGDREMMMYAEDFQLKNRIVITRSDSFHSIGQQKRYSDYEITRRSNLNALPQRSTSFLSLVHSQKAEMRSSTLAQQDLNVPYNRQKSTSELSISDVPSLQSLEVIKNILNCRKASLQDINSSISKSALGDDAPIIEEGTTGTTSTKIDVLKSCTEKVIYNDTIEKKDIMIKKLETQKSEPVAECNNNKDNADGKKKSEKQQWRYSGPPKINFSTWNERPKAKISVMNDKDYIFGGVSTTLPCNSSRNNQSDMVDASLRHSNYTVIVSTDNNSSISSKDSKEAERRLPKVLGVEYKKDVVVLRHNNNANRISESSSSDGSNKNTTTLINIKQRPATMDYSANVDSNYQNNQFVSFNRLISHNSNNNTNNNNSNMKKYTPIVHGFVKLDNISETQADVKSLPITNKITDTSSIKKPEAPIVPAKPSYLRLTSADAMRNVKMLSAKTTVAISVDNNESPPEEMPFSQTLRRTGLIEKMLNNDKKMESMFGKVLDQPKGIAEENVEKVTFRQYSQPAHSVASPPPPPMPLTFRKSAPVSDKMNDSDDARSQLLDAIKNFNMDSLRRK